MAESRAFADLMSALILLRQGLEDVSFPLSTDGADEARTVRRVLIDQLDDYVLPRLLQIDAPLLAVVGGSTGAGKSTLVNSLVGRSVSPTGVLRPTTRSPLLVHHPDDAYWFEADRILPDLPRSGDEAASDGAGLRLVASDGVPQGVALLDAPDVDSVDRANRDLAAALLAAADLWLFVTSAARYADQVPWQALADAARRSTAVAVVLDRVAPEHATEVRGHLARMLIARGLKDSPLFGVPEMALTDGLLPPDAVESLRGWLLDLAANPAFRGSVVERSLLGTLRTLVYSAHQIADAAQTQVAEVEALRVEAGAVYDEAANRAARELGIGVLLRGSVLTRWEELVASGEPARWAQGRSAGLKDRVSAAVLNRTPPSAGLEAAVHDSVSAFVVESTATATELVAARWHERAPGRFLDEVDVVRSASAARERRSRATEQATQWQAGARAIVRTALAATTTNVDRVRGIAAVLQVAALGGAGGKPTAMVASPATPVGSPTAEQARHLLGRALDANPSSMIDRLVDDLHARTRAVLAGDRDGRLDAVTALGAEPHHVEDLRKAASAVDHLRPANSQT